MNITDVALADRGNPNCDLPRPPTSRYPVFSTTLRGTFGANGNLELNFASERDILFIGMSVTLSAGRALIDAEYCNTKLLVRSSSLIWPRCCERKPIFLVGVRDNKRLQFRLTGPADETVKLTLHGFQGDGCCG